MTSAEFQLHAIVDAWEALQGGRQVRNSDIEAWLANDMAPAINAIRGFLRRPRPDGILPPPPTVGEMTPDRAVYFLKRFKGEEKMLGPHEQWALDFAIAALAAQGDDAQEGTR